MTNEEARAYFIDSNERTISVAKDENGYNYETQQIENVFMRRDFEAKELAIQALEQQPCEDTEVIKVSKGAVKARQGRFVVYDVEWLKENFYTTEEKIYGQPKQPCEDCISREAVIDHICEDKECYKEECKGRTLKRCIDLQWVFDLPPVTPQRPKGKWIRIAGFEDCNYDKCSVCGVYQLFYYGKPSTNYCPNCGAEMSGGVEDEDGKSL